MIIDPIVTMGFSFYGSNQGGNNMLDSRFERLYILKTKEGEVDALKHLCEDYEIETNGVFENAAHFHRAWGICEKGLIYLSHTMFIYSKIDFNSLEEFEHFLAEVTSKNLC